MRYRSHQMVSPGKRNGGMKEYVRFLPCETWLLSLLSHRICYLLPWILSSSLWCLCPRSPGGLQCIVSVPEAPFHRLLNHSPLHPLPMPVGTRTSSLAGHSRPFIMWPLQNFLLAYAVFLPELGLLTRLDCLFPEVSSHLLFLSLSSSILNLTFRPLPPSPVKHFLLS